MRCPEYVVEQEEVFFFQHSTSYVCDCKSVRLCILGVVA